MEDWRSILINKNQSILDAIKIIDQGAMGVVLVVDEDQKLAGVVTDGDVRRGILQGLSTNLAVSNIMNKKPKVANVKENRDALFQMMQRMSLHHIPLIDDAGVLVGLEFFDNLIKKRELDNLVVIMAGGLGERLRPLTNDCPKPLLKINSKPMLQIILESFITNGFHNFCFAINYRGKMIQDYFKDGSDWGVNINYLEERQRLGTAGPLGLLSQRPHEPIVVMNGDIMTNVNFQQLLDFHCQQKNHATVCVREYHQTVPYGVVKIGDNQLLALEEKPVEHYFVNAGIYVLEPKVLDLIPGDSPLDMPELLQSILTTNMNISAFPLREYWTDIGRMEDYQQAHKDYLEYFA